MNGTVLGFATVWIALSMGAVLTAFPVSVHSNNGMWIEPSAIGFSPSTPVGITFNITIWFNVTTPASSWQFYLTYPPDFLNAFRCGYSDNGKSRWSGDTPTVPSEAHFGTCNGYRYVVHSEALAGNETRTGCNALSWVTFNLTRSVDESMTGQIRLDDVGIYKSCALDKDLNEIPLTFENVDIPEFSLPTGILLFLAASSLILIVFRKVRKPSARGNHKLSTALLSHYPAEATSTGSLKTSFQGQHEGLKGGDLAESAALKTQAFWHVSTP